jgi:hypothetical protein
MSKRRLETIEGRAASETVHRGTASEHEGVVVTTLDGEKLVLERVGGNPFEDGDTQVLIGHEVAVEGFRLGSIFRYVKATEKP